MRTSTTAAARRSATTTAAATAPADRRNRVRLRELCDEVLASFRVASAREVISEQERMESLSLLSRIAPLARR
jgi:hypothetical protein